MCYFLRIKKKLSIAFHPYTNGQTKRQNSIMETYLRTFVNQEQDDWAKLLPMAEFAYNNAKNATTGHTPLQLNCGYHPRVSFEEDIDPYSKSHSANKLAEELKELIEVCCQNLLLTQELQKRVHNKEVKSYSYTLGEKVWLNSKYIKIKWNKKLKNKFFRSCQVLYTIRKQVYQLELPTKQKIYNIFHVSLLEQNITRKRLVDNTLLELEKDLKFEAGGNKEYEVKAIINSVVYSQQTNGNDQRPGLCYLVLWKSYSEEENTWETPLAVIHLQKLINIFHKEHPGETSSNLSTLGLCSANGQTNSSKRIATKTKAWLSEQKIQ